MNVSSASIREFDSYGDLLDRLIDTSGTAPRAVIADRGYSVKKVFRQNTELGIASVIAWRASGVEPKRKDYPRYDRHGIPRCKHCHGPTRFVRFCDQPKPRLWYRCELGTFADCRKESPQSMLCQENWRLLVPIWRTSETYMALRTAGLHYEGPHQYWRSRYGVAGDSSDTRPKRRGRAWQQLRANAAMVVEWLGILHRMGWLGSARRVKRAPVISDPSDALARLRATRDGLGLNRQIDHRHTDQPDQKSQAPPGERIAGADPDAEDIEF